MSSMENKSIKRVTVRDLQRMKGSGEKIVALTASDFSFARLFDRSGVDLILVGDSLAMVSLGHENTLSITLDEMLHHCKAVARGSCKSFLVGDMPFLSYQINVADAVKNAGRFLSEAGMNGVKLEGGLMIVNTVEAIVRAGIPVMGHIGLMPQYVNQIGGYIVQGNDISKANSLLEDALALEKAGCFALVLESIPQQLGHYITDKLSIPTIGIGSGVYCDGQVLVGYDLLGLFEEFKPKFVKRYGNLSSQIIKAVEQYSREVKDSSFPTKNYSHMMSPDEFKSFLDAKNDQL